MGDKGQNCCVVFEENVEENKKKQRKKFETQTKARKMSEKYENFSGFFSFKINNFDSFMTVVKGKSSI